MTIPIQFLNVVIRRAAIDKIYPGGSLAFIREHAPFDGTVKAYDEKLVKFGAMSAIEIDKIAKYLVSLGFEGVSGQAVNLVWIDFCVIDELFGLTQSCYWIKYDTKTRTASCIDSV